MDGGVVPIVPAAVIFDLPVGGWKCRPTAEFGYAAAESAGQEVGRRHRRCRRRRAGRACSRAASAPPRSRSTSGVTVGAIVVVNAAGDAVDPGHRTAVAGLSDRGVRPGRAACRPDRRLRRPAHRVQPAQHHHRRGRHRRRAEPGRRAAASRSPRTTVWPAPSGRVTRRWTAIRCSRWPPAPSRCRRTPTTPASMSPEVPLITAVGAAAADCPGPRGAGRRAGRRVGRRNTDLPGHVARSVRSEG